MREDHTSCISSMIRAQTAALALHEAGIVIRPLNEAFSAVLVISTKWCSFIRFLAHLEPLSASRRVIYHSLIIMVDALLASNKTAQLEAIDVSKTQRML